MTAPLTITAPGARDSAEMAVLGIVITLGTRALDAVIDEKVRPEHFYRPQHQSLLAGMLALKDAGRAVDALTLKARFDGPQSPVNAAEIELLAAYAENPRHLRDYCKLVREGAWYDTTHSAFYDAYQALEAHDRQGMFAALGRIDNLEDAAAQPTAAEEFVAWYESDTTGWPLPFDRLNDSIGGGMRPGEVTVLGGWSGMGKTFLLSQMLRKTVMAGARVHEYASEMHGPSRTARTLTSITGIPAGLIEHKRLNPEQLRQILEALKTLPYETSATAGWRVEDYCRDIRRKKWDVAAIDTIANLPCSRVDEWDRACSMLADAAAQAGTHLIEVAQLNLERDKGKKPPPVGRDIRNTGAWYQRARVVMFIHRDQESKNAGDGQVIWQATSDGHVRIEKATHGDPSKGFVPVTFNPRWLRFEDLGDYQRPMEVAA